MEIIKFELKEIVGIAAFYVVGSAVHFCKPVMIDMLNLPVGTKSFTLKVSTQPIEGYKELSLRRRHTWVLIADRESCESLYPYTSKWVDRNFRDIKELWVKPFDIKPFICLNSNAGDRNLEIET